MRKGEANLVELTTLVRASLFLLDRGHHEAAFDLEASAKKTYGDIYNEVLNELTEASANEPVNWEELMPKAWQ